MMLHCPPESWSSGLLKALVLCLLMLVQPAQAVTLVIATVDNGQMLQLQELSGDFKKAHPDIRIRWLTLSENELRRYVSADIDTQSGQIDVITVGMYEVPIWAQRGWLREIKPDSNYGVDDLLPNIREGLSSDKKLYAAPLYGESSILMFRQDLMDKAGLKMPARPSWADVAKLAAKLNDPANGVHGICLRGSPGWGENVTLVTTMVNAFGGQWFDMGWRPQLDSEPWRKAVEFYIDLLRKYGPKNAALMGYNENLALFRAGKCAMWVDASVAAGFVSDPQNGPWAKTVGFAPSPSAMTAKGSQWLWSWALAIPGTIDASREAAAQQFISWATSREYVKLVASKYGWRMVPSGTRKSTYLVPEFRKVAPWASLELESINSANPRDATLLQSPYMGVQFAVIPEFRFIGDVLGKLIAEALTGQISIDQALSKGQYTAKRQMVLGGYLKAAD